MLNSKIFSISVMIEATFPIYLPAPFTPPKVILILDAFGLSSHSIAILPEITFCVFFRKFKAACQKKIINSISLGIYFENSIAFL